MVLGGEPGVGPLPLGAKADFCCVGGLLAVPSFFFLKKLMIAPRFRAAKGSMSRLSFGFWGESGKVDRSF